MSENRRLSRLRCAASALLMFVVPAAVIAYVALSIADEFRRHEDDMTDLACALIPSAFAVWSTVWIANRHKSLGRRFWAVAALASLLPIYALSFGPACRLYQYGYLRDWATDVTYRPMWWLERRGPPPVGRAIRKWVDLFLVTPADWIGPVQCFGPDPARSTDSD